MKQKSDDGRRIEKWKRKQNVNAQYIHRENLKISNTEKTERSNSENNNKLTFFAAFTSKR